jgi:hypothetical protein
MPKSPLVAALAMLLCLALLPRNAEACFDCPEGFSTGALGQGWLRCRPLCPDFPCGCILTTPYCTGASLEDPNRRLADSPEAGYFRARPVHASRVVPSFLVERIAGSRWPDSSPSSVYQVPKGCTRKTTPSGKPYVECGPTEAFAELEFRFSVDAATLLQMGEVDSTLAYVLHAVARTPEPNYVLDLGGGAIVMRVPNDARVIRSQILAGSPHDPRAVGNLVRYSYTRLGDGSRLQFLFTRDAAETGREVIVQFSESSSERLYKLTGWRPR